MEVKFETAIFYQALTKAIRGCALRDTRAELLNIKLEVEYGQKANLIATDGNCSIRVELPAVEIACGGKVILPAQKFKTILSNLPEAESIITLRSKGDKDTELELESKRALMCFTTQDASLFPIIPVFTADSFYLIERQGLWDAIQMTRFAVDNQSSHYALSGICIELSETGFTAVATDGRRLVKAELPMKTIGIPGEQIALVPVKGLELVKTFSEETVDISAESNSVWLRCGEITLKLSEIEGRFPNWRKAIPNTLGKKVAELGLSNLVQNVRIAQTTTTDKHTGVHFNFSEKGLRLASFGEEVGSSTIEVPSTYDGETSTVNLDCRFLIEYLNTRLALYSGMEKEEKTVKLYFQNENSPVRFDCDNTSYTLMSLSTT